MEEDLICIVFRSNSVFIIKKFSPIGWAGAREARGSEVI